MVKKVFDKTMYTVYVDVTANHKEMTMGIDLENIYLKGYLEYKIIKYYNLYKYNRLS
jgi:hypothetical protein